MANAYRMLWCLVLLCPSAAQAAPRPSGRWTIPPGQERVVAAMLGGAEGIGDCTFGEVAIDHDVIDATFRCAARDEPLRVVLAHQGGGDCRATACTTKLAITITDQSAAPPGFADALRARIMREEGRFRFVQPMIDGRGHDDGGLPANVLRFARTYGAFIAAAVLASVLTVVFTVRRRRARAAARTDAPR